MPGLPPVWWTPPAYNSTIGGRPIGSQRHSPEFKDEAVRQILERGYSVTEVSERRRISSYSLYNWVKAVKPDQTELPASAYGIVDAPGAMCHRVMLRLGSAIDLAFGARSTGHGIGLL